MIVPALECLSVTKIFGGVLAVDNVSLTVPSGSVSALMSVQTPTLDDLALALFGLFAHGDVSENA